MIRGKMSILEFIASKESVTRTEIGKSFSMQRHADMIEREISFLVINGLIARCATCTDLRYSITEKGKESLPHAS
jgi:predicted transcriptional regulator